MSATPLIDRIAARRQGYGGRLVGQSHRCDDHATQAPPCPQPDPEPITERMSPFMRRLAEKRLPVQDRTSTIYNGAFVPADDGGAA